jgi:uncharacterized membrane protein YedE/YeeE
MYFSHQLLNVLGVDNIVMAGLDALSGCTGQIQDGIINHNFALTIGLLPGSLMGALFAGEFRLRYPRLVRRYVQALLGGVLMGYASGMAIGCTIGAFFSAVPSLSVSGWVFGLSLAGGAFIGTKVIRKLG